MKKIFTGLLIAIVGILFNIEGASAKTFNWNEFMAYFINNMETEEENVNINDYFKYDEDSLDITINEDGLDYSFHLDYDKTNNLIKFANTRDLSKENEETRKNYYVADSIMIILTNMMLIEYYDNTIDDLNKINDLLNNSSTTIEGEELKYIDDASIEQTAIEIKSLVIDINKLDNLINNNSQTTTTIAPTTTTTVLQNTDNTTSTSTTTIKNPETGETNSQVYLILGVICLVGIVSLGTKFAKANK